MMKNPKKILIVDDDPDLIETCRFRFSQAGYDVVTAINGWEALGAVRATEPDLVILDVMMPHENGYRVSRIIKDDMKRGLYGNPVFVMIVTARIVEEPERIKTLMEFSQADEMLYKPFAIEELVERVNQMFRRRVEEPHG